MQNVVFFFTVFFALHVSAQNNESDMLVNSVNDEVAKIEAVSDWDHTETFEIENFTSKKAFLNLYYQKNRLIKVTLEGTNRASEIKTSYYLKNGVLFYVLEENIAYMAPSIGDEYDLEVDEYEQYVTKSYFKDDTLVRQLDGLDESHSTSAEYLKAAGESILDDFKILLSAARSMDK